MDKVNEPIFTNVFELNSYFAAERFRGLNALRGIITLLGFLLFSFGAVSQSTNTGQDAVLYFKDGTVKRGTFDGVNVFQKIKLADDGTTEKFAVSLLDSIWVDPHMFQVVEGSIRNVVLVEGALTVRETIGGDLTVQSNGERGYIFSTDKLNKAYRIFCTNSKSPLDTTLSRSAFLSKVKQFNAEQEDARYPVRYDSLKKSIQPIVLRLGFFLPQVGLELGIARWLSFYNSFGINFFGNVYRNANEIINFNTTSHLRFYPGFQRRLRKGNHIYKNSGFYFGPTWSYGIELGTTDYSVFGMAIGWQETNILNKASSFATFGLGYDPFQETLFLLSNISLGVAF